MVTREEIPQERIQRRYERDLGLIRRATDRAFAILMPLQWLACIASAVFISPRTWVGPESATHHHVWAAILIGGTTVSLPCLLVWFLPGRFITRWAVASAQAVLSALLIHMMGGRIEAHFHIFGALAFLSFYRDRSVYVPMIALTALDHTARGLLYPESVYGIASPTVFRSIEHSLWVVYETAFLVWGIRMQQRQLLRACGTAERVRQQRLALDQEVARQTQDLEVARRKADRLSLVVRHADCGVIITDPRGRTEWANDAFTAMCGYSLDEIKGRTPGSFLQGPNSDPGNIDQMRRSTRLGLPFKAELVNYAKDGAEYLVQIDCRPIRDEDDQLTGFFALERDVTEERQAEALAERDRRRTRAQLEAIDRVDLRIEFTPDGRVLECNHNFGESFGYDPAELVGQDHRLLVPEAFAETEEYRQFRENLKVGAVVQGDFKHVAKDGSERWLSAAYLPVLDEQGKLSKIVKYAKDLTEKHALEEDLSRARKLESIGQLSAGLAHEINTPMQFVGDNLEFLSQCSTALFRVVDELCRLLKDESMPRSWDDRRATMEQLAKDCRFEFIREQMPGAIEESREGVRRTVEIVGAMKSFSHLGEKEKTPTCLNELVESTVAISRNRWKHAAELKLVLEADLPKAPMFASEINQVLLNLIVNAVDAIEEKYGAEPDALGDIGVRTYADADSVIVEVIDDGVGMPDDVRAKIFDPFFTTKDVGKGTGQGLSLSHNVIVNQHGGTISVNSSCGKGTKFTARIPIVDCDAADEVEPVPAVASP